MSTTAHPPITHAIVVAWLDETGRSTLGKPLSRFRLTEGEKQELLAWAAKHQPDKWEQDGEKVQ